MMVKKLYIENNYKKLIGLLKKKQEKLYFIFNIKFLKIR
jgi:hypothetical protein